MKRFNLVIAAAVAATLLLSACNIVISPPGPPPPDFTLSAGSPTTARWSGTIARGQQVDFLLNVPSSGVYYIELDANLQLELRAPNDFRVVASSSGPGFFARGSGGLSTTSTSDLSAQAIGLNAQCRGSCIIFPMPSSGTYYARVSNAQASAAAVDVYFYADAEQDLNEQNDTVATATPFNVLSSSGDQGAIELLGDVDFYRMSGDATIQFSTATGNPVGLQLVVVNSAGQAITVPIGPGSINVFAGDYVKVYSGLDRAGAPAASQYTLLGMLP